MKIYLDLPVLFHSYNSLQITGFDIKYSNKYWHTMKAKKKKILTGCFFFIFSEKIER